MPDERFGQGFTHSREIAIGTGFRQHIAYELELALQYGLVLLCQVCVDQATDEVAAEEQDGGRRDRKIQREKERERARFPHQGCSGASITYPMPRTVRISLGSKSSSTFARSRRTATSMTLVSLSEVHVPDLRGDQRARQHFALPTQQQLE